MYMGRAEQNRAANSSSPINCAQGKGQHSLHDLVATRDAQGGHLRCVSVRGACEGIAGCLFMQESVVFQPHEQWQGLFVLLEVRVCSALGNLNTEAERDPSAYFYARLRLPHGDAGLIGSPQGEAGTPRRDPAPRAAP